jgi:alpha,alpha-trehalase
MVTDPNYARLEQDAINVLKTGVMKMNGYDAVPPILAPPYQTLYCWDTYFTLLGLIRVNTTLAREDINAQFTFQNSGGMIMHADDSAFDADMNSQVPLLSDAIWQYYCATGDLASLQAWYPKLEQYYAWYNATGQPSGALPWTTSASTERSNVTDEETPFIIVTTTGMDNSATYDSTDGNCTQIGDSYYLNCSDVLLSTAMADFASNLAAMSQTLGYLSNKTIYDNEYACRAAAINSYFWDPNASSYSGTVNWDGAQDTVDSQLTFIPLFANVTSVSDADALMQHYNSDEFNRTNGVPTIAANDSAYYSVQPFWMKSDDPTYWRGNEWVYLTYLMYKGLKNYGFDVQAHDLAVKWVNLVMNANVPFAEYYNAKTGQAYSANSFGYTPNAAVTLLFLQDELSTYPSSSKGSIVVGNGTANPDFSDVRFYIAKQPLYYWCDPIDTGRSATFWFRIPDNLAGQPVDVYYGNSNATWDATYCNGTNTFLFFDDFNEEYLDSSTWNWLNGNGSCRLANSYLTIIDGPYYGTSGTESALETKTYMPPVNTTITSKFYGTNLLGIKYVSGEMGLSLSSTNNSVFQSANNQHVLMYSQDIGIKMWEQRSFNNGSWQSPTFFGGGYTENKPYYVDIFLGPAYTNYTVRDFFGVLGGVYNNTDAPTDFAGKYYLGLEARGGTVNFDYVYVRPTIANETCGWISSQEEAYSDPLPTPTPTSSPTSPSTLPGSTLTSTQAPVKLNGNFNVTVVLAVGLTVISALVLTVFAVKTRKKQGRNTKQ